MLPNKKYSMQDFAAIARKRSLLIIVPIVLGFLVALVVSSRLPNVYEAETLIQIVPQRVPDTYVRSTVTIRTEDRLDALSHQVQSRTQLERMILELNLYPEDRALRPMQDVVEKMRLNMSIQTVRPNRMEPVDAFYLRFKYSDPVVAARVTERLGSLYIDYNARERGALATGANEFLEAQLGQAKQRLEAEEARLQAFRERHAGKLPSQLQYNMQAIQSTQLQRQALVESLARDRDRKLMLERLYNDAITEPAALSPHTSPPAGTSATITTLPPQQQLDIARANLAALAMKLKEGHPDLRRAARLVADLEKQVAEAPPPVAGALPPVAGVTTEELQRRERISSMRAEIESLDRQIAFKESEERRLGAIIADYQNRIEAVPGVESEWMAITRDYDTIQLAFKDLLTKSESAKVAADLEVRQIGEQFRILDAPRVPLRPISPQRVLITAGGVAAGLIIGLLLVGIRELGDRTLKTEVDVEAVLALPVVAIVPTLLTDRDRQRLRFKRLLLSAVATLALVAYGYTFWAMRLWKFIA
jgi:polysaccharide chain length determinant protein (PEP-CTERM system associated)